MWQEIEELMQDLYKTLADILRRIYNGRITNWRMGKN